MRTLFLVPLALLFLSVGQAQVPSSGDSYPYVFRTFAGSQAPLGDGGPATQAYLRTPYAVAVDSAGNIFILDSSNNRIRKIDRSGLISTVVQLNRFCFDMALGRDGNFYLTSSGLIFRVGLDGVVTPIAGTGIVGNNGGDGVATLQPVGSTAGIALDADGNVYFVDGSRVRKVTVATGRVSTIAGTAVSGYNGDNQPATTANLNAPRGLAIDASGALFIGEFARIRKVSNGIIQTLAGNGVLGRPGDATPSNASPLGRPERLFVTSSGVVYFSDPNFGFVMKVTPIFGSSFSTINWVAGCPSLTNYSDGPAIGSCLRSPGSLAVTPSGDILVTESSTNRVRQISNGSIRTIGGRDRFAGDGGPAISAILNNPAAIAMDQEGNAYVADTQNYRIRKIDKSGKITTFVGNGTPANPDLVASGAASSIGGVSALAVDRQSNLYFASGVRIYKVTPSGRITVFAGSGLSGDSGDGGKATNATFRSIPALAVDSESNVLVLDWSANRVRKISAVDGVISAFAGSGTQGFSGDGGLATAAALRLGFQSGLAIDALGNVFIPDWSNNRIRMVSPSGLISTIAGNGVFALPASGAQAKTSGFFPASGLVLDSKGSLYAYTPGFGHVYKLDSAGVVTPIANGNGAVSDGAVAGSVRVPSASAIAIDALDDLYVPDEGNGIIYKLISNSPSDIKATSGNNQTGSVGSPFSQALRVTINGRAGIGVAGVLVNFTVASGSASLSVSNARTDASGVAGIGVTPTATGPILIKASLASSNLPAAEFTLTGTATNQSSCSLGVPSITSVKSASDFGGLSTFASGSWLEIKGSNLASNSRAWTGDDFQASKAPISLDGTRVSINGNPAFVYYISPGQLNVQAPADSQTGPAEIKLSTCAGTSAPAYLEKASRAPGLLAPASFLIGGRQYLAALHLDGSTFVGPQGLLEGVPFRPAKPGDSISIYGTGFGAVTPDIQPGIVAEGSNALPDVNFTLGSARAEISFAGLAPGTIGLYQFNLIIPELPDGDTRLSVSVGGQPLLQTLYLTIGR